MGGAQQIRDVLFAARDSLEAAGVDNPVVDAELIVAHVLSESRGRLQALMLLGGTLSEAQAKQVELLIQDRASRVPLQHLTGKAPFRSLDLAVGPGVFIPRPETEIVAGIAIEALRAVPDAKPIALDLCTGSGAIALAIVTEVPTATVYAVEMSLEAHAWAARNVASHGDSRVELHRGDIRDLLPEATGAANQQDGEPPVLAEIGEALKDKVHVLVSNPPYVPDASVPRDPEVRDHDPELALFGGMDGLDLVRVISRAGLAFVVEGGMIVLEHAEGQGEAVRRLLTIDGWHAAATFPDLLGRDRATTAIR